VALKLLGSKHEFLLGLLKRRILMIGVKRVDDQGSIDFDRVRIVLTVEEDSASEAADAGMTLLMHHRVGPKGDDFLRRLKRLFLLLPRKTILKVQRRCTSTERDHHELDQEHQFPGLQEFARAHRVDPFGGKLALLRDELRLVGGVAGGNS
jgi:hypothetical protein